MRLSSWSKLFPVVLVGFLLPLAGLFPGCGGADDLKAPTEYQAVFLDNGQVFFGKLEKAGPHYLILRDVFYVQTRVDQDTKQTKSILVKRGLEWHAPDFMQVNTRHVVLVEPVAPESQVAQLIRYFKKDPPPAAPPEDAKPPAAGAAPEEKRPPVPSAPKPKAKEEKRPQTGR